MICTMRKKSDYVVEENDKGKKVPRKIGLKDIQKDGLEYEFDLYFEATGNQRGVFQCTKDTTQLFDDDEPILLTDKVGMMLINWANSGVSNLEKALVKIANADYALLKSIHEDNPGLHDNEDFLNALNERREEIKAQLKQQKQA
jgi:hypothetical protein